MLLIVGNDIVSPNNMYLGTTSNAIVKEWEIVVHVVIVTCFHAFYIMNVFSFNDTHIWFSIGFLLLQDKHFAKFLHKRDAKVKCSERPCYYSGPLSTWSHFIRWQSKWRYSNGNKFFKLNNVLDWNFSSWSVQIKTSISIHHKVCMYCQKS